MSCWPVHATSRNGGAAPSDPRARRGCAIFSTSSTSSRRTSPASTSTRRPASTPTDPETNDLATLARDRAADLESMLLFVELEWLALDDVEAGALLQAAELEPYVHRLRVAREEKPYILSEGEEQALNARRPAISAWESLHGRELATLTVEFDGGDGPEPHTIDRLLSYVHHHDRELRLAALDVLYEMLESVADVQAACYDAIVGDRLSLDRLRGIPDTMWPTNQRNELDGAVVEAMMAAVEAHYALGRRWFVRKAEVLGLDRLQLADQYAPVGSDRRVEWTEAVGMVEDSLSDFEPRLGEIFRTCLERGHVDAEPRPGKVGGAYCNSVSKTVLPYVLLNYTDQLRDVVTLAHEFGHAVHGTLALERQTYRSYHTGIALAEVPSTFAQLLAVERLIDQEEDPSTRVMLLADRAEGAMASIFRQTMMARFETRAYAARSEGKALTRDRLAEMWIEENERYYADSIELHPRPLLHVRLCVRTPRRVLTSRALPRGSGAVRAGLPRVPRERGLALAARPSRPAWRRPPRPADVGARLRRVRPLHRRGGRRRRGALTRRRRILPVAAVPGLVRRCRRLRRGSRVRRRTRARRGGARSPRG